MAPNRHGRVSGRRRSEARLLAIPILLVTGLLASFATVAARGDVFASCEQELDRAEGWNACGCLYSIAVESGRFEEADRRLTRLLERGEGGSLSSELRACATFNLGRVRLLSGGEDAMALLERAAVAFESQDVAEGAIYSRLNASRAARRAGDDEGAARQLELARGVASRGEQPLLLAQVELQSARLALARGADLDEVGEALADLEESSEGLESPSLWRDLLQARGNVAYLLGRFDEASLFYRRMAQRARASGDRYGEATALLNRVIAESATDLSRGDRGRLRMWLKEALAAARGAGQKEAEIESRLRLALVTRTEASGPQAKQAVKDELESVIEQARILGSTSIEARATAALAREHISQDPVLARGLMEASEFLGRDSPHFGSSAYGWADRLEVAWRTSDLETATSYGYSMLETVEDHRRRQRAAGERAEVFAVWTEIFYAFSGRLMKTAVGPDGRDLTGPKRAIFAQAFDVLERMRARVLLESLQAFGGDLAESTSPVEFVSLQDVQSTLGPRRAMLSFQSAPWENAYGTKMGGTWLSVITEDAIRAYRVPGRPKIASALRVFSQMVPKRDGSDAWSARRLHEILLDRALGDLPASVDRLVIIADGPLHRLPFARLLDAEGRILAERFALSLAPSATVWSLGRDTSLDRGSSLNPGRTLDPGGPQGQDGALGQKAPQSEKASRKGIALIVADPALDPESGLPPLPASRQEARRIRKIFGGRILEGEEASMAKIQEQGFEHFNIWHLAAHAVVDGRRPERSHIALAPSGPGEPDGPLRASDIAALDLDGRLIVLAACRGGDGRILAGEGPMSLARAFFEAGANTVVASLWPLRDDEASLLFEDFYSGLARGSNVASALAYAQQESRRRGEPAAAWGGLVVLGDGDAIYESRVPPLELWIRRILSTLAIVALTLFAGAFLWLRLKNEAGFKSPWSKK